MDRVQETTNLLNAVNDLRNEKINDSDLIRTVCAFFDTIKNDKLNQADLRFLKRISLLAGIPHFYDLLQTFDHAVDIDDLNLDTFSSLIYESTLHTSARNKVHKYQKIILQNFDRGKTNRYFLSASTSFGKTHIVYELIRKMDYNNVVLIFPTIALLSENLEKIMSNPEFTYFKEKFDIHTLSDIQVQGDNNLFIYTPERYLSYVEKDQSTILFDFAFIDEIYKIDNDYIIDDATKENERDVAYRLAVFYSLEKNVDVLLAGPYIDFSNPSKPNYNPSFNDFLYRNNVELIDFNEIEIVNKSYSDIKTKKDVEIDDVLNFSFTSTSKNQRLIDIIHKIVTNNENTIVYCASRSSTESYAKRVIDSQILGNHNYSDYESFINHLSTRFHENWVMINALKNGIGVHHGLVPKYIQKEVISLFNRNLLKVLFSTTTITEGVNTSAKNLVVLHSKKGSKPLKKFDAKNIAGRAGRFLHHYSGRVIVLQNDFMSTLESEPEGIKHKNFDLQSPKDELDLFYTDDSFLNDDDKQRKININQEQQNRGLPDFVFDQFKIVSRMDKMRVYDNILRLNAFELLDITTLIQHINFRMNIFRAGFQVILKTIYPIIKNDKLKFLIETRDSSGNYSIFTHLVYFYLRGGFRDSMRYKIEQQSKSVDSAIRETSDFVFNLLKYQSVKYLGVFNLMYKFHISKVENKDFDDVSGIDRLLTKLEYNALSEQGRLASDFGVPARVLDYFENTDSQSQIRGDFDDYEKFIFEKFNSTL
ncbi:MAG: helicase-related protein [Cyclobacteriaceae bacterium]